MELSRCIVFVYRVSCLTKIADHVYRRGRLQLTLLFSAGSRQYETQAQGASKTPPDSRTPDSRDKRNLISVTQIISFFLTSNYITAPIHCDTIPCASRPPPTLFFSLPLLNCAHWPITTAAGDSFSKSPIPVHTLWGGRSHGAASKTDLLQSYLHDDKRRASCTLHHCRLRSLNTSQTVSSITLTHAKLLGAHER